VVRELDQIAAARGYPLKLRLDNGLLARWSRNYRDSDHRALLSNYSKGRDGTIADRYQTNAAPKLVGHIDSLEVDVNWDTEHFGVDQENKCLLKVTFTLRATLLNESAAPTTISGFQSHVLWKHGHLLGTELPVEDYSVTRRIPRSDGEWGYETVSRRLRPVESCSSNSNELLILKQSNAEFGAFHSHERLTKSQTLICQLGCN
jgi:hypothetical protein